MPTLPQRTCSMLASAVAAAGMVLAVTSCAGHITPLGPNPQPAVTSATRQLGSPFIVQVMRNQFPTATDRCPAGSVALFGLALAPRIALASPSVQADAGSKPTPTAPGVVRSSAPAPGVACYHPVGTRVTITSAAISAVTTDRQQAGPPIYGFVVAVPTAYVSSVTAVIRQAYDSGGVVGISVDGKLWEAPRVAQPFSGQQLQVALLSKTQAVQLYRLLVPSG